MASIKKQAVINAISAAVTAQGTVLAACKEAAKQASVQFDKSHGIKEKIENIMDLYKDELAADHNVRALFKDALTLFAAADTPVSVEVKRRGEDAEELHTTAQDAVSLPKHQMREAAKQVREANGMARATGGGRKPKQPESAPKQVSLPEAITSSELTKNAWYEQFDALIKNPELFEEFKLHCKDVGIVCYRKK